MKAIITWASVVIWLFHLVVGAGAGYAAIRLWGSRRQPLIRRMGLFLAGYVVEVISAVVLLFVAKGVVFTLKFSAVMFGLMLIADALRVFLILYIIKGPQAVPQGATSAANEIREIVKTEIEPLKELIQKVFDKLR